MALKDRLGWRRQPEVIELTEDEFEAAKKKGLERLGLTFEDLQQMARDRNFSSAAAHSLWVAIGGGYGSA